MIRRIRDLLYDQGFTISGARNKMQELLQSERDKKRNGEVLLDGVEIVEMESDDIDELAELVAGGASEEATLPIMQLRRELFEIRELLVFAD
jgi:hypothetical protein